MRPMTRFIFALIVLILFLLSPTLAEQPLKVAILPFKIHSQENIAYLSKAIYDMLAARLSAEGKIEVVPEPQVEKALRDHPSPEAIVEVGKRLKADWVVRGSLTKVGEHVSIDAELINIRQMKVDRSAFVQGQGINSVIPKVSELGQILYAKMLGGKLPVPEERVAQPREAPVADPFNTSHATSRPPHV